MWLIFPDNYNIVEQEPLLARGDIWINVYRRIIYPPGRELQSGYLSASIITNCAEECIGYSEVYSLL
jgi:hypothetical protein